MLSLDAPTRTIAGVELAQDSDDPFAFHVLPPRPRVVVADGAPRVGLVRFVQGGKLTGGHLELSVELSHPDALLDEVRAALRAELGDAHDRVVLRPVTVIRGSAELVFVGREATDEGGLTALLKRSLGACTPMLDAPYTARFAALLTESGARLVEDALRSGAAPVGITYRLQVEALRPGLRVTAHVDWSRVYEHLSAAVKEGYLLAVDDIQKLSEQLVESKAVRIDVVQALAPQDGEAAPPPDLAPALAWIQREIVERCCEPVMTLSREPARASLGTLGDMLGVGTGFAMKHLTQIERAVADIAFDRSAVVVRTLVASAHLADLLGDSPPDAHISDAGDGSPFFERARLHLATARPLADTFVREVVALFRYGATEIPIRLTPEAPEGAAETWADQAADRAWSLPLTITLDAASPVDPGAEIAIPALSGQSRELTLDLEQLLGLRAIEVHAAPDDRVLATRVELTHLRGREARQAPSEVTVTAAAPTAKAWLRDVQPGDRVEATTRHLLRDGRLLAAQTIAVETRILRAPPAFPGVMIVQIYADDDWSELERVVVSLQKREDTQAGAVVLDKAGASAAVSLDLPDPADRTYRYRVARTLVGGAVEEDDWRSTDRAALLVGRVAADKLVVDVTPLGLEPPEAGVSTIEIELRYIDPENQVRDVTTAIVRARADRFRWEVALKDPARKSYDYQITTYYSSGTRDVGPWITTTDRVLPVPITKAR